MTDESQSPWCRVCATRHDMGPECPGELLATGPERYGYKANVVTSGRRETYCVLIAEAGDYWRARIATLPNMLWCVPGGRVPMKIVGISATQVEAEARRLIIQHCAARKLKISEDGAESTGGTATPKVGAFDKESALGSSPVPKGGREDRFLQSIALRFGEQKADHDASTSDISKKGLFVVTTRPLPKGRRLKLVIELEDCSIPLSGTVMWVRLKAERDRLPGMGVRLAATPAIYLHYVRSLNPHLAEAEDEEESPVAEPGEPSAADSG